MPAVTSAGSPTPPSSHDAAPAESPSAARGARGRPHSRPTAREFRPRRDPDRGRRPRRPVRHHSYRGPPGRRDRPRGGAAVPMSDDAISRAEAQALLPTRYRVTLIVRLRHAAMDRLISAATMDETPEGARAAAHDLLDRALAHLLGSPG